MKKNNYLFKHFVNLNIFFLFFSFSIFAEVSIPALNDRVNDLSGILDSVQINSLENKLENLEKEKGSQVAILIIPTTDAESIEGFSLRVVEKWKLGRKNINDGVLILIAINDRKMRIEVGYGLEGVLPDAICKRIITEQMKPNFKDKNYYEGLNSAVDSISKLIHGETLPPPSKKKANSSNSESISSILFFCIFIFIFGSSFVSNFTSSFISKLIGSGVFGFFGTAVIIGFLSPTLSEINILLIGFIIFLVFTLLIYFWSKIKQNGTGGGSGYWSSSSNSDSWSSSSSDSFSGGGGSFGGGGASGDW